MKFQLTLTYSSVYGWILNHYQDITASTETEPNDEPQANLNQSEYENKTSTKTTESNKTGDSLSRSGKFDKFKRGLESYVAHI